MLHFVIREWVLVCYLRLTLDFRAQRGGAPAAVLRLGF